MLKEIQAKEPAKPAQLPIQPAGPADETVLADVGVMLPKRDPVDERIIKEVRPGVIPPMQIAKGSQEKAGFYGYAPQYTGELADLVTPGFPAAPGGVGGWPEYKGAP